MDGCGRIDEVWHYTDNNGYLVSRRLLTNFVQFLYNQFFKFIYHCFYCQARKAHRGQNSSSMHSYFS
jgi:hypothetical protein